MVGTALLTDAPSRVSGFHHWQCFGLVDTEFETLCSNDISQDKFGTIWEVLDMLVSSRL